MKIQIPTACSSCGSKLEQVNSQLFCRNSSCPAQSSKKVEHFAKVMKIKGLGPASIEKLELESIPDIFYLPEDYITDALGEKVGKKVYDEINKSKQCEFSTFLSALSIPLIGRTAAQKIADAGINSLEQVGSTAFTVIGPKAGENLLNWYEQYYRDYEKMPMVFTKPKPATKVTLGSVCITGKLRDFKNREEAGKHLRELGYKIVSSVTKTTNYLVDEEGKQSSKRKKAEQLNIDIMSIKQLEDNINYE